MSEQTFGQGEILFRRGDSSDLAYLIASGEVEVLDERAGGEVRVGRLSNGDIVGEMSLVDERPRFLTARALTEVRASAVTREGFVDLILHNPEEGLRYLRALFERMRSMNRRASDDGEYLRAKPNEPEPFEVTLLPLTQQAAQAVPATGMRLPRSPFRIGRTQGTGEVNLDSNDLMLADQQPYHVSRNHFSIEIRADGVVVNDRGSRLGTIVNGTHIGGKNQRRSAPLVAGDNEVLVGSTNSPFQFCVSVASRS